LLYVMYLAIRCRLWIRVVLSSLSFVTSAQRLSGFWEKINWLFRKNRKNNNLFME
jgi:hypothetical protein